MKMPENPDFALLGCDCGGGCVTGRGGGADLPFDEDALDVDAGDRTGIVGFFDATGSTFLAGSLHALFTSLISQLFVV